MNLKKLTGVISSLYGIQVGITLTTCLPDNILASVKGRHIVVNGNKKVSDYLVIKAVAHELAHLRGKKKHNAEFHALWDKMTEELWNKYCEGGML